MVKETGKQSCYTIEIIVGAVLALARATRRAIASWSCGSQGSPLREPSIIEHPRDLASWSYGSQGNALREPGHYRARQAQREGEERNSRCRSMAGA